MKRFICLLGAVCLLAGLTAGCGKKEIPADISVVQAAEPKETEEVQEPEEKQYKDYFQIVSEGIDYLSVDGIGVPEGAVVSMVGKDIDSAYWKKVKEGAEAAVADLNEALSYTGTKKVKLSYDAPTGEDVAEQIDIIDQMLDKNPDALCIGFVDVNSGNTQLELAEGNGVPVLAVDSGIENDLIVSISKTDNYEAGREGAKRLCETIGDTGKIGLIVHSSLTETGIERERGFLEEIEEEHREVQVAATAYLAQDERGIEEIVADMRKEHPDIDAWFATNGDATEELLEAIAPYQTEKKMPVVGFDSGSEDIKALERGELAGTLLQNPYGMGYTSAVAAFRAIAGMENASKVDTGYYWVTGENLKEENIQALLYK